MASKLYLISPPKIELLNFIEQFKSAISGGLISMFQLRLKDIGDEDILHAAEKLLPLCRNNNIKFIINDSSNLALASGADGVHIGSDDGDVIATRKIIGNKILGTSCYNSLDMATRCTEIGADYVSFGAFYPTKTKVAKTRAELSLLTDWKKKTDFPCAVIGGINSQNAKPLITSGADYICTSSFVWNHPVSAKNAVQELTAAINL